MLRLQMYSKVARRKGYLMAIITTLESTIPAPWSYIDTINHEMLEHIPEVIEALQMNVCGTNKGIILIRCLSMWSHCKKDLKRVETYYA